MTKHVARIGISPAGRLLSILVLSFGTAIPAPLAADEEMAAIVAVPLSLYLDAIPSLQVRLGDQDALFLLDTAGGVTLVTPQLARSIGCDPWGQIVGFRMRGERVDGTRCDDLRLQLPGVSLTLPTAGVWDLMKIVPRNAPMLGGSLALDAFAKRAITLKLAAGQLVVETPASLKARVRTAIEVPVRFSRDAQGLALTPLVAVETSRGRLWMELDCGSDGAVIVGKHAAQWLQLDGEAKGRQKLSMKLVGGIEVQADASVADLILDGNIGAPILRLWEVTIDLLRERLWIKLSDQPKSRPD